MIRAVLFDLDGTIADTAPDLGYALNQQLALHGKNLFQLSRYALKHQMVQKDCSSWVLELRLPIVNMKRNAKNFSPFIPGIYAKKRSSSREYWKSYPS